MRIIKAQERWFEVPNDPDRASVKIKQLSPGEIQDIFDEVFVQKVVYSTDLNGKLVPKVSQKTNKAKDRQLTLTGAIVDWKNFFDSEGRHLDCNNKNIMRAAREITGFAEMILEFRKKLAEDIAEENNNQKKTL